MDSLFGTEGSLVVRFIVAFVIVLGLIGVTFWLIRRFGATRVGAAAQRGRQPRLAVIDAAPVDGRRRLVLIRRDNVEHLLMIGGPSDVVVEQNILRAVPVNAPRDMPVPRAPSASEGGRPAPEPRAPAFDDEPAWAPPPQVEVARPTPRPRQPEPRPIEPREPRPYAEPALRPVLPPSIAPTRTPEPAGFMSQAPEPESAPPDAALASMAQRLEAALRRPGAPEPRPLTSPLADRAEPPLELPASEPPPTAPDSTPAADAPGAPKSKSVLDSLEAEMASLLGRPPDKPEKP